MSNWNHKQVLLLEDNEIDALSFQKAVKKIGVPADIIVKENGEEGLSYLKLAKGDLPGLIVLDLNMPNMNGLEFLKEIKDDGLLRSIPVVVLTTSGDITDKMACLRLGVVGYMVKPVSNDAYLTVIRQIFSYWGRSSLPN